MKKQSWYQEKIKKFIKIIAKERGLSPAQYYKISNDDIYDWILSDGKDRYFTHRQVQYNRMGLPKIFRIKRITKVI